MIEHVARLTIEQLGAVADLERRVVAADGGRLKLEWGTLRNRSGELVEDLLWWQDGQLAGFLGIYTFGGSPELAGMVAPELRRRGIGSALVDTALGLCGEREAATALLVVPRTSAGGSALAVSRGGVLDHSEHVLLQATEPADAPADPRLLVRAAVVDDASRVASLLSEGFGHVASDVAGQIIADPGRTLVVELDGDLVGTLRMERQDGQASVYGFVVDPAHRGRGIGREVLRRVCRKARADGARQVALEVAVDNDRALGLYTSLGFEPVATEDYFEITLG